MNNILINSGSKSGDFAQRVVLGTKSGDFAQRGSHKSTDGSSFYSFLKRNAHEVGHIPQLKCGNIVHIVTSLLEFGANIADGQDWHDGWNSSKEPEADIGEKKFAEFNRFVDEYYGGVETDEKYDKSIMIQKLFKNKNNSQRDIINRINIWWNKFNEMQNEKKKK